MAEETNPTQGVDTTTLDYAVSQLTREPEAEKPEATPSEEPEETAEYEEGEVEQTEEEPESEYEEETEADEVPEEESDEDSEEEETESEGYYTVKVDGEELEVTLDELRSGYQRQKDYTKKTQHLAEQRKQFEQQAQQMQAMQDQIMQQAAIADEILNRDMQQFQSVDWETLKAQDPVGFVQKQIELQDVQRKQAEIRQRMQAAMQYAQQTQAEQTKQFVEAEKAQVMQTFPEWKNPEKAKEHQTRLVEYGRSQGYDDSELASLVKARDLVVLDKARKYDEMMSKKKGITKKEAPAIRKKVVRPKGAAPKGASQKKVVQQGQERLRKSGSLRDAAALMYEMQQGKAIRK